MQVDSFIDQNEEGSTNSRKFSGKQEMLKLKKLLTTDRSLYINNAGRGKLHPVEVSCFPPQSTVYPSSASRWFRLGMDGLVFRQSSESRYVLATICHIASVRSSGGVGEDLCKEGEETTIISSCAFWQPGVAFSTSRSQRTCWFLAWCSWGGETAFRKAI